MISKRIAVSAILLATLAASYFYLESRKTAHNASAPAVEKLVKVEWGKINSIIIRQKGETVELAKENDVWTIKSPISTRTADGAVGGMLLAASKLTTDSAIENPADLKEFGLADPAKVTFYAGESSFTLNIGDSNPAGDKRYVAPEGSKSVYLAGSQEVEHILRDLTGFRERNAFSIKLSEVKSFTVKKGATEIEAMKTAGKDGKVSWTLEKPGKGDCDAEAVNRFLEFALATRAEEFYDDKNGELKKAGLEKPFAEITLNVEKTSGKLTETLILGAMAEKGGRYAKASASASAMRITEELVSRLPSSPDDFRDLTIVKVDRFSITSLKIETPEWKAAAELKKTNTKTGETTEWRMTAPTQADCDQAAVDSLLSAIETSRGKRVLDAGKRAPSFDKPAMRLTFSENGKEHVIRIARYAAGKQDKYAAMADNGTAVEIDAKTFNVFNIGPDGLMDTRFFHIRSEEVGRIVVRRLGQVFDVARKGDDYVMASPDKRKTAPDAWNGLLWMVTGLKPEKSGVKGGEKEAFGKTAMTLSVYNTGGALVDEVTIGSRVSGHALYFARSVKRGGGFAVAESFVNDQMVKTLENLVSP